jgi:hypothetical protein
VGSAGKVIARFSRAARGLAAALLLGGCDLVDVSFTDGGIVLNPRLFPDGGAAPPGEGEGLPVPGPQPGGGRLPDAGAPPPPTSGCQADLIERSIGFAPAAQMARNPSGRPDITCTVEDPVFLQPVVSGVTFRPARIDGRPVPIYASCALASSLGRMAQMLSAGGVTDAVYLGVYGCRVVAGTTTLSEHGRGRAFDLSALRTANGVVHTVLMHWERDQPDPVTPSGQLLRQTVESLYEARIFNIILTPDYNAAHANHFHLDLTPGGRLFH